MAEIDITINAIQGGLQAAISECGWPANAGQETLVLQIFNNSRGDFRIEYDAVRIFSGPDSYLLIETDVYNTLETFTSHDEAVENYLAVWYQSIRDLEDAISELDGRFDSGREYVKAINDAIDSVFPSTGAVPEFGIEG